MLLGCVLGFLGGELAATLLLTLGVALDHYPGGLSALVKASEPPWWANVLSLLGLWIGFAAAIVFAVTGGRLRAPAHQWRLRASDLWYVVLGVACQGVISLAYEPLHIAHLNKPTNHLFGAAHGVTFALVGILTVVGAPIIEEWFFRGVLYRALRQACSSMRRGATAVAVLGSAVLFGAAHGEPAQFAGLAGLGIVLAVLVQRTQRLMPSVITHVSFNAVAVVAVFAQRSGR